MTEVNFKEDVKIKIVKKSNKPIAINSPVKKQQHRIIETEDNNHYNFQGETPVELTGGLKNVVIYGLLYPCKNKKKLAYNLHQSKYTHKYLDKYMSIDMISGLDDHTKFGMVYAMNFVDAFLTTPEQAPIQNIQKSDDTQKL